PRDRQVQVLGAPRRCTSWPTRDGDEWWPRRRGRGARPGPAGPSASDASEPTTPRASERLREPFRTGAGLERGVLGDEGEVDRARRPVALLADDDLGHLLTLFGLDAVPVRPVDEEDEVGVLFQGTRLPKIGELGLVVLALPGLDSARELGQRQ